jgi:hypothetical protein
MDYWLGSIISDITLYNIIKGIIIILSLFTVYLGIQIALTWKFLKKDALNSDEIISQKGSFIRSCAYMIITGIFMLSHEFFEGLKDISPDSTTYELFELLAFMGLVLFFFEWYNIINKIKKKTKG